MYCRDGEGAGSHHCDSNILNSEIYANSVSPVVDAVFRGGQDGMVIAYGGGGSGKTHTLTGVPADPGCVPLAVMDAFRIIGEEEGSVEVKAEEWLHSRGRAGGDTGTGDFRRESVPHEGDEPPAADRQGRYRPKLRLSYLELSGGDGPVRDLLSDANGGDDDAGSTLEIEVSDADAAFRLLARGTARRGFVWPHSSSECTAVIKISVDRGGPRRSDVDGDEYGGTVTRERKISALTLVDLAGSERSRAELESAVDDVLARQAAKEEEDEDKETPLVVQGMGSSPRDVASFFRWTNRVDVDENERGGVILPTPPLDDGDSIRSSLERLVLRPAFFEVYGRGDVLVRLICAASSHPRDAADTRRTLHLATQAREMIPPSTLNARHTRPDGGGNDDNNNDDDGDTTMGVSLIPHPSDLALEEVLRCREEINELRARLATTETKAELGRRELEEIARLRGEEMALLRRRLAEAEAVAEARRREAEEESRGGALIGRETPPGKKGWGAEAHATPSMCGTESSASLAFASDSDPYLAFEDKLDNQRLRDAIKHISNMIERISTAHSLPQLGLLSRAGQESETHLELGSVNGGESAGPSDEPPANGSQDGINDSMPSFADFDEAFGDETVDGWAPAGDTWKFIEEMSTAAGSSGSFRLGEGEEVSFQRSFCSAAHTGGVREDTLGSALDSHRQGPIADADASRGTKSKEPSIFLEKFLKFISHNLGWDGETSYDTSLSFEVAWVRDDFDNNSTISSVTDVTTLFGDEDAKDPAVVIGELYRVQCLLYASLDEIRKGGGMMEDFSCSVDKCLKKGRWRECAIKQPPLESDWMIHKGCEVEEGCIPEGVEEETYPMLHL